MRAPRYALMWSGGKDSALALSRARAAGLEVAALLNFVDETSRRVRFHATRAELIAAQAAAIGLLLRQVATAWTGFEAAFRAELDVLVDEGFAGIVFGDVHLADVRGWYEERVRAAGLEHVEPLWSGDPATLLREFVGTGGRAVVTCCEVSKLDRGWLGRLIDERFVDEIAATGIDPCGENGEYHSFAFAGPPFRHAVAWAPGDLRLQDGFAQMDVRFAHEAVADDVVAARAALVGEVRAATPKAWGRLAALGVVAYRERVGRAPGDTERRALWSALWRAAHQHVP